VYGVATEYGLVGFVLNDSDGVLIEVEGSREAVDRFRARLLSEPPPLAVIEELEEDDAPSAGARAFEIRSSIARGESRTPLAPDVGVCADCLQEIRDPNDRRYRYPFTNCTNCGPRFTITAAVPYDRANTTMAGFAMCPLCREEYEDPGDRRFHAQPIACPECGPSLRLIDRAGTTTSGDPLAELARILRQGGIGAIKGLGGYHLACDARDERAVAELRKRKAREEKPLAVMVSDVAAGHHLGEIGPEAARALMSVKRPIVLVPRLAGAPIADSVAPGNRSLGLMLPYTPLHDLLMSEFRGPLVLTSGNVTDEPIVYRDEDAFTRLEAIADVFLTHDRPIQLRCDDSVVRVLSGGEGFPIRRARGYAPEPLHVNPGFHRPVLGVGPELKLTFCLGVDDRAILSHHIGDLQSHEAMVAFEEGIEHFERVFDIRPEVVAHDLHPDYLSTKWAQDIDSVVHVGVQHHHAHIASCLADNVRSDRVIGLALDGTGWGPDGAVWGCEILTCDLLTWERAAHLRYVALPGGAAAVRQPWRMAAIYLTEAFRERAPSLPLPFVKNTVGRWRPILQMAATSINSPLTSSAGRLFDAAAALCDLRRTVSYEGQAAAELEQLADPHCELAYPCSVTGGVIDGVELIAALAEDLAAGRPAPQAAAGFHNGLSGALVRVCEDLRARQGLATVALSGGTWQNLQLTERVRDQLVSAGFEVLLHRRVPPNDGGISLGQAVVANAVVANA
jgi:hydrogenase maturation protein HypF